MTLNLRVVGGGTSMESLGGEYGRNGVEFCMTMKRATEMEERCAQNEEDS